MLDLCKLIFEMVVDLLRSRAMPEAKDPRRCCKLTSDSQGIDEHRSRSRKLSPKRIRTEIVKHWLGIAGGTLGFC